MRIQQTDRILEESRAARHNHERHKNERSPNVIARAWRAIVSLFKR